MGKAVKMHGNHGITVVKSKTSNITKLQCDIVQLVFSSSSSSHVFV